ncbi:MAG TPA: tRNA (adenosine(37)-N6)-dimethylallyltransferase MiaA [Burkholderiales bacterium]|nr:tRNA (adenosine(37)-N6)-dimethylallyltransferase MiaA [Burkholderiales bacterium]
MGPTASGKSALAMALAAEIPVEIISVDSAQVYRDMNIGTAKPSATEQAAVRHHLIDIIDPTQSYSAAQFAKDADALMQAIHARGRTPLLVGGTMLYFKALREGLSDLPPADPKLRAKIEEEAASRGWPALHAELAQVDPATAARVQPGDAQRIQRALEIYRSSGRTMSALMGARRTANLPFQLLEFALLPSDRSALHERIAERFDAMLANGLVEELRGLQTRYELDPALASMRCVGYRQSWLHLTGAYDRKTLRERGIFATRQLAKRQLTWLRSTTVTASFDCISDGFIQRARDSILRSIEERR